MVWLNCYSFGRNFAMSCASGGSMRVCTSSFVGPWTSRTIPSPPKRKLFHFPPNLRILYSVLDGIATRW